MKAKASQPATYGADSIEVLQNVDHIRKRPAMYVQDTGSAGVLCLAKEVLDNAADEHASGHGDHITVLVDRDNGWVEVTDRGRGIPVERHAKTGISTLATVFLYAGAGGKFGETAYRRSAGLHGVGVTVVNALSSALTVWSCRAGRSHRLDFHRGVCRQAGSQPDVAPLAASMPRTGTIVRFQPDDQVFGRAQLDLAAVREMAETSAVLFAGLTVELTTRYRGRETTEQFCSQDGLAGFVRERVAAARAKALHEPLVIRTDAVEVVLAWTSARDEVWHSFVNGSKTPDHGVHVTAVRRAITAALSGLVDRPIDNDDLRAGLLAAVHARVAQPQFQGQVKNRLMGREVETAVYEAVRDPLAAFVKRHRGIARDIVGRAARLRAARERFDRERDAVRSVDGPGRALPVRLARAPNCRADERELFLVEGESAAGSAKQARDPRFQEVLGLKGKIPNAEQKTTTALFENDEIRLMVAAIGAGVGDKCDARRSRVGKILLLMDADPDGQHITALALSFLVRYLGPVVDAGLVWVVRSPLFRATWRDRAQYGDTIEDVRAAFPARAEPTITRFKGHGEASVQDLRQYAMQAGTRKIARVLRDGRTAAGIAGVMGRDADARKLLIGVL